MIENVGAEILALSWDQGYFNAAGGFDPRDGELADQLSFDNPYRYGDDEADWIRKRAAKLALILNVRLARQEIRDVDPESESP